MKNYITSIIILLVLNLFLSLGNLFGTKFQTEKHSVHPEFGNYVKRNINGEVCKPWDYCPDPGVCK